MPSSSDCNEEHNVDSIESTITIVNSTVRHEGEVGENVIVINTDQSITDHTFIQSLQNDIVDEKMGNNNASNLTENNMQNSG